MAKSNRYLGPLEHYGVYDSLDAAGALPVGAVVYITGKGDLPEGLWRRDSDTEWHFGVHTPQTQTDMDQVTISAGGTQIMTQFTLPTEITRYDGQTVSVNSEMVIWQAHIGRITGSPSGLRIEIEDTDAGNQFFTRDAADGTEVEIGFPLAQGGEAGNRVRIRARNTSGQQKSIVGFIIYSLELHEPTP